MNDALHVCVDSQHSEAEDLQERDSNEEDVEKEGDSDQAREDSI